MHDFGGQVLICLVHPTRPSSVHLVCWAVADRKEAGLTGLVWAPQRAGVSLPIGTIEGYPVLGRPDGLLGVGSLTSMCKSDTNDAGMCCVDTSPVNNKLNEKTRTKVPNLFVLFCHRTAQSIKCNFTRHG